MSIYRSVGQGEPDILGVAPGEDSDHGFDRDPYIRVGVAKGWEDQVRLTVSDEDDGPEVQVVLTAGAVDRLIERLERAV